MAYPMESNYPPQDPSYPQQPPPAPYPSETAKQTDAQGYPWAPQQQPGYPASGYPASGYPAQYPPQQDPSGRRINYTL